ncbi:MAG: DUF1259 domain-containing protein [Acidobacteriota bacterium]
MRSVIWVLFILLAGGVLVCSVPTESPVSVTTSPAEPTASPLDTTLIDRIVGVKGVEQQERYKISVPQNDLSVSVDGFRIIPPMGLTSWAAFAPASQRAIVMGDLVVQEDEIGPVEQTLIASGLTVSGLHNHFVRDTPKVMFMHIHGVGQLEGLARGVRAALDKIKELRQAKGLKQQPAGSVEMTFDPKPIDRILGHSGDLNAGVYKITISRPDVILVDHGVEVSSFMGFNTWMAFQGTPQKAAVAGDFAMLEHEVAPVIEALVKNSIEVVAVHNHMTTEDPRIFFLHFWGVAPVEELAQGLKAGLDQTRSSGNPGNARLTFDDVPVGTFPTGWKVDATNPAARLADWSVQKDPRAASGDQVLAVKITDYNRGTFNLCWTDQIRFENGFVEVKVRAGEGRVDQGGGPIWRAKDANNHYIARWNPLENNFRLYYVKEGRRVQLDSAEVDVPADEWHTIRIEHEGDDITGYLNGQQLLEARDSTFSEAGGVGLWTKADAASFFDDFEVEKKQ